MTAHVFTGVVSGMTCEHCVASVTEEVQEIPGVQHVEVDLATGELRVTGERLLDQAVITTAVEEAGYRMV